MFRRTSLCALLLSCLVGPARADLVVLKDGRRIEGKILARSSTEVRIKTAFAELTFPMAEVEEVVRGKTVEELHAEKLAACRVADDFGALGLWCLENRLKRQAKQAFERALELDPDHEGARRELGFVRYDGAWMIPEERDARQRAKEAAEMRARGLVLHGERWVTPEERAKLELGLVLHEGRWMTREEAMRAQGLEEFDGQWYPRNEARARAAVAGAAEAAGQPLGLFLGKEAVVCGTLGPEWLERISGGLDAGRAWFDAAWRVPPGPALYGDQLCEFYVFHRDAPYELTVEYLAGRSSFLPEGWKEAVRRGFGFTWIDPIPISSVRQMSRELEHVVGHSYHHLGHLMISRLAYRGRLLPPWYEEGTASLTELRIHGRNDVFCRTTFVEGEGISSESTRFVLDEGAMRDGEWRGALTEALKAGRVEPFDRLARREFSQLTMVDIATSLAILEWLETQGGEVLARFHVELRKGAPEAPTRVIQQGNARAAYYDAAFKAAVGTSTREADAAWRTWFLSR